MQLSVSDVIDIIGIIISLVASIAAIIISVKTLRQNSKMIEESTRPLISMYIGTTYFSSTTTYLIMKNYGASSAVITDFSCSLDLSTCAYDSGYVPYSHVVGSNLCPGESLRFPILVTNLKKDIEPATVNISYKSQSKTYTEKLNINFSLQFDMLHVRANTKDQHLKEISFALQDIAEKML